MESPFKRLDDEKFAALMDRWLANGGVRTLHEALKPPPWDPTKVPPVKPAVTRI